MDPANNCTNEISPTLSHLSLEEKCHSPEDGECSDALEKCIDEALQMVKESAQSSEESTNSLIRLVERSEAINIRMDNLIESEQRTTQALRNLKNSSSEMKETTSNIANFAKRFFNPVRNGFYLLTRHREPAAVLPRENQLAIEDTPENTISITDTTNQTSDDEKKKRKIAQFFYKCGGAIYFILEVTKNLLVFLYRSSINLKSKINLWFRSK